MDVVEEIKRRLDLVEYIGRVSRLQKSGRNFKGICPFHTEKTPSFYVFPDRGTWRCFGSCGEGGDLFSFVQKRENLDFRSTLRVLAAEAGVELSPESSAKRTRSEHLSAIMSAAVDFYQRNLREEGGAAARDYVFGKRGLKEETVESFRIGWAPDDWRLLRDYLTGRGYDEQDAIAAGLLVEAERGGTPYDRFRGRLIIPIADERGQYVAMGGRGLQREEPKYLNSPQTDIFDKGRTLFGLHLSAPAIRESGVAVVVEGYMDVMGPWQAGFKNVVATMGTSLTEHHVALLRRWSKRVVLAMDPDAAGLAAAERAGGLFMGFDSPDGAARAARSAQEITAGGEVDLRVAPLPAGRDPDELAREDPEGWQRAVTTAAPFAEFLITRLMLGPAPESPMEARAAVDRVRPVLLAVKDPVERGMYVQRVARHLDIGEHAVMERLRQGMPGRIRPTRDENTGRGEQLNHEDSVLALLLRHPSLRAEFRTLPDRFFSDALDRSVFLRWSREEPGESVDDDPFVRRERELLLRRLPPLTEDQARQAVRWNIGQITRERFVQHQATTAEEMTEAERNVGVRAVAEVAAGAWRGLMPPPADRELAEMVLETQQLGLSIHRREEPGRI